MDHLLRDLRFAFRSLVRNPALTLVAAASLALGIGSAASVFSAVDVFMLRPLAYPRGDRLVAILLTNAERGWTDAPTSWPDFSDWRKGATSLELAAYHGTGMNLSGGERPERLAGLEVSAGFLKVLGVTPQLGRGFLAEEENGSPAPVVILSNAVWQRDFGGDPAIVGRTVDLDAGPYQVVGVLPPRFQFDGPVDLLVPLRRPDHPDRASRWVRVVGRLRPGANLERARSEMAALQGRLASTYPNADGGTSANVVSLQRFWFNTGFQQGSLISSVAVLFVLLIACANIANLLLARGAAREREIALRSALGAGRARIVRQLLTESVILSLVGGGIGMLLASEGIRWVRGLLPGTFPQIDQIVLNHRVVLFTLLVTVGSGILFGLAPALQGVRTNLRDSLAEGGRGGAQGAGGKMRRALVVAEVSLSFVLLVSATLLVQAFSGLRTHDLGFARDHRVTARLSLPAAKYPTPEQRREFFREMEARIAALPGVAAEGLTSQFPLGGANRVFYTIPDAAPVDPAHEPSAVYRYVSPEYFHAMGMTVLSGRRFTSEDVTGAPPVLIVNRKFAERHWPGRSPLGQKVQIGSVVRQIVGVVNDTYDFGPDQDPPVVMYQPLYQQNLAAATLVVETTQASATFIPRLREAMRGLDPDQPLYSVRTVHALLEAWIAGWAAMAKILGAMALIAFLLAAVGVYGVMAYSVSRRTQEVGVRVALGARRGDVLRLVLRQGGAIAVVGIGIGLLVALATTRFLAFFLVGVSPYDPLAFTGVAVTLLATCLVASWIPALRATRVDPILALKAE